ncbi:MAG: hypothetical protein IAI50_08450, partial [Candidatus Eremiobacteraeota bacterium]|nr:hypothetical protein [Candidatus Eremiobacteraeota bacterium]
DPARTQADRAVAWIEAERPVAARGSGMTRYLTTGSLETYRESLAEIVGFTASDTVAARPVALRR